MELVVGPDYAHEGLTKAFTNIVGWAFSSEDFEERIRLYFSKQGWHVLEFQNVKTIDLAGGYGPEIESLIERAETNPAALLYSTFHFYEPQQERVTPHRSLR